MEKVSVRQTAYEISIESIVLSIAIFCVLQIHDLFSCSKPSTFIEFNLLLYIMRELVPLTNLMKYKFTHCLWTASMILVRCTSRFMIIFRNLCCYATI